MVATPDEIVDYAGTLDFQQRPAYHPKLVAMSDDTPRPVGKYLRPVPKADWIACGLNGCDQPHRFGFVIRLQDGRETHCGPICGEKTFGTKWAEVEATVKAAEEAAATRRSVASLLVERDAIVARASNVAAKCRELEARIVQANLALSPVSAMRRAIDNCARSGGSIRAEVKSEAKGIAAGGRPGIAQLHTVGTVDGIELLTLGFMRYSTVIDTALPALHALDEHALQGATQKDLARRSKEGQAFTGTLDRAERQLMRGVRLFERKNLEKLDLVMQHMVRSDDITPRLRRALDDVYLLADGAAE